MKNNVFISLGMLVLCLTGCHFNQSDAQNKENNQDSIEAVDSADEVAMETNVPDIQVLAKMLVEEKNARGFDDAPFIAYIVDTLGFKEEHSYENEDEFEQMFKQNDMRIVINRDAKYNSRFIRIRYKESPNDSWNVLMERRNVIWEMVVGLMKFGLEITESNPSGSGGSGDMKGKGLTAGYGPHSISLGYVHGR